jgi:hypothetical protein
MFGALNDFKQKTCQLQVVDCIENKFGITMLKSKSKVVWNYRF